MSQEERLINGELLRLRRETQGWVITDMALRACLSAKQVRQLEEGGSSAFYSESVKLTAAKKVGALLGLSPDEVFVSSVTSAAELHASAAETPAAVVEAHAVHTDAEPKIEPIEEPVSTVASMTTPSEVTGNEEAKPKTSIWAIAGLFAAALAVAAYMQPKEEAPVEPAPPLQVVPSEADAAASAAEAAASAASTTADPVVSASAQKAASSAVVPASTSVPAASAVRAPGVVASGSVMVRPASAASGALPAAPAASKAP